jgi:hypothetical protein
MGRRILSILGAAVLVTVITGDAFGQRGQGGNGNNGQNNGRQNGRSNGDGNGNGNAESVPAVPEIAIASGAGALALLAGGLLVLRGRRRR